MSETNDKNNPLGEVFGFPPSTLDGKATRYRKNRLCPFNNKVPSCTKDKANDPLGVCSIYHKEQLVITCPIRFRENWIIADDAAEFFFGKDVKWTTLTEVKLSDINKKTAGIIDVVLVSYDNNGKVSDFGALEIQAVYISGNIRSPFEHYMQSPNTNGNMTWKDQPHYPRPDYLSSSRKRLVPQLMFKGGILNAWNKKIAVALNKSFFDTLPAIKPVNPEKADIAWILYDLVQKNERYELEKVKTIYTEFLPALNMITNPRPGNITDFMKILQNKVDDKLEIAPNNKLIDNPLP
ncbi:MAG: NotI family restriction endonuclease [Candidatus Auribacterota bacterium]